MFLAVLIKILVLCYRFKWGRCPISHRVCYTRVSRNSKEA